MIPVIYFRPPYANNLKLRQTRDAVECVIILRKFTEVLIFIKVSDLSQLTCDETSWLKTARQRSQGKFDNVLVNSVR